jgi:hypothetical protein
LLNKENRGTRGLKCLKIVVRKCLKIGRGWYGASSMVKKIHYCNQKYSI